MRVAKELDIPRLLAIEFATQIAPWSEDVFQRCFKMKYDCWVIEEDNQVIGFLIMSSSLTKESHILNLCIDPAYQRKGYGRKLLTYSLSQAKAHAMEIAYLEVRRSNYKAINLYNHLGFIQIGERKNYYPAKNGREDALVFAKDLGVSDFV